MVVDPEGTPAPSAGGIAVQGGWRARNYLQKWSSFFDGHGLEITPDSGSWMWGPTLTAHGYRGQERLIETPKSSAADVEKVSYQWDSVLREWYINGQPRCTLRIASQPSVQYAIERPSGENSGAQSSGADAHRRRARAM